MHKFIHISEIRTKVTKDPDCDVLLMSGAWGSHFLNHFFNHTQRNHQLCIDKMGDIKYEYVFLTTQQDYERYKSYFTVPDITFLIMGGHSRLMSGIHMDYAHMRGKPMISLASDCLHTTNLIPNLMTKYAHHNVCGCAAQRVCPQIIDMISTKESEIGYEAVFEPREFMKLCLPTLYPSEKRYFADNYSSYCNGVYWRVFKDDVFVGELIRAFHVGIIYVANPQLGLGLSNGWGMDSNPFMGSIVTPENIGMIADSDDGFCVDVSTDRNAINVSDTPGTPVLDPEPFRAYWKHHRGNGVLPIHESLMGFNTVLHSEPLDKTWLDVVSKANEFVTNTYHGEIKNKEVSWDV